MSNQDMYINWINVQLEKRHGSKIINNLSSDMRDGVAFLQLVEVNSKEPQQITRGSTLSEMRLNIKRLFAFMSRKNIKFHKVSTKEIIEGNEKSIMCLVLALAVYFKPEFFSYNCFQSSPSKKKGLQYSNSVVSMVSNAAVSLSEATKNASHTKMPFINEVRNEDISRPLPWLSSSNRSSKSQYSYSEVMTSPENIIKDNRLTNAHSNKSIRLKNEEIPEPPDNFVPVQSNASVAADGLCEANITPFLTSDASDEQNSKIDDSLIELSQIKEYLYEIQNLLIHGDTNERFDETLEKQLVSKSVLCSKNEENRSLKVEISDLKEENLKLFREKTSLEHQHTSQEHGLCSMKSKLLNLEVTSNNCLTDNLQALTNANARLIHSLYEELSKRDAIIQKQSDEINIMKKDFVNTRIVEANLQTRLESCSSMISSLKHQLHEMLLGSENNNEIVSKMMELNFLKYKEKFVHEHSNVCVTLSNIRKHFKTIDPIQHAFESLDHSMSSFMNIFLMLEKGYPSSKGRGTLAIEDSSCCNGKRSIEVFNEKVKVVYFLGKSTTPILNTSDIRLGLMTLGDIKRLVNRPGSYRYFFKTVDSDFGFVRKEFHDDNEIIPGSENKIVAWIEKSTGEE